ncbi:hypothetical protein AAFM46_05895 [Arthrobacter sp. TMP15]|uniref:hypothetical protein n=1 Tax=Arthrobacter sp. TMP15 TaxID=3140789 RepID=UPI0031BAAA67
MSNLFSHAPNAVPGNDSIPAARVSAVTVPVPVREAFDGFTDGIHLWWPVEGHSIFGAESHIGFETGLLLEDSFTGSQSVWGEIRTWAEPTSLAINWHRGSNPLNPTIVSVNFSVLDDESTTVVLTHDGWAPGDLGHEQFEIHCDWPLILSRYVRFMGGSSKLD